MSETDKKQDEALAALAAGHAEQEAELKRQREKDAAQDARLERMAVLVDRIQSWVTALAIWTLALAVFSIILRSWAIDIEVKPRQVVEATK